MGDGTLPLLSHTDIGDDSAVVAWLPYRHDMSFELVAEAFSPAMSMFDVVLARPRLALLLCEPAPMFVSHYNGAVAI